MHDAKHNGNGAAASGDYKRSREAPRPRSSSKKASPQLPTDSDIERMEESLRSKFGISGEITASSFSLVAALCTKLEHSADELDSCMHQSKLLKSSNERLIRENEQLLRTTEKKDRQIRELQTQLERLLEEAQAGTDDGSRDASDAPTTARLKQENELLKKERDRLLAAATARKSIDGDDDRKLRSSISVSLSGRHQVSGEIKKLRTLEDQVDTLQREKEFLERQLRTNKGEAGRKLEEFAESVNSSIKTIVSEREMLNKKNKEYCDKLKGTEDENRELKLQVKKLKEDVESLRSELKLAAASSPSPPAARAPYQPVGSSPPVSSAREHELIKDLESNIRFLTAELEHTSLLVAEKDNIIKQLQQRAPQAYYEDSESRSETDDMILQLHEKKKEKQRLEMELIDARTNMRKIEEERNRLDALLADRTQRFDDYHETKTALGVLEQKCQVQSDTLAARERELDRARKLIEDLTARENRLQRSCNDLNFQVSSLSQQLTGVSQENEDAANRIRQLLADSNFYQKKFQKKEAKLAYTLQVLNTKEKELQDMLATNRRLNDLSTMFKKDLDEAKEESASLNQAVAELRHRLQHVETSLRSEQQRCKRYEELFDMERRKAEESREVREHLQRHITKWESMKEELSLLQRGKELQDNELHRLRKDNEGLRHEKDRMSERMRELAQASDSAKSTVELQDMTIARLEEEKASLKDYVLKYEAELSKHEAQVAQLTADLQQMEDYGDFLERMNRRMEELVARMNDNASDRDRLLQEFDRLQRTKKNRGAGAPRTPMQHTGASPSSPTYHPYT